MTKKTTPKQKAKSNKGATAPPPMSDDAKLAAFAIEFRQIEGEGLERDIKQGLILSDVREI